MVVLAGAGAIFFNSQDSDAILVPTATSYPVMNGMRPSGLIDTGSDGNVWFTLGGNEYGVGSISPSGTFQYYSLPAEVGTTQVIDVADGADGQSVWYSGFNTSGTGEKYLIEQQFDGDAVVHYLPAIEGNPYGVTAGPDGNMWYVTQNGYIGNVSPSGQVTSYLLPSSNRLPYNITTGPDDNLWVTYFGVGGDRVAKVTTSGVATEYLLPAGSRPFEIISGPDDSLWIGAWGTDRLVKMATDGSYVEYQLAVNAEPRGLTVGPDGNVWYISFSRIGYVDVQTEEVVAIDTRRFIDEVWWYGITLGSDNAIWFTRDASMARFSYVDIQPAQFGEPGYTSFTIPTPRGDLQNITNFTNNLSVDDNGEKVVALDGDGQVIFSNDAGITWSNPVAPIGFGESIVISGDGSTIVATEYGTEVYVSRDDGQTWENTTESTPFTSFEWAKVVTNQDGSVIAALTYNNEVVLSTDGGLTWTDISANIPDTNGAFIETISISADGTTIVLTDWDGGVYVSRDTGTTWQSLVNQATRLQFPDGVAASADFQTLVGFEAFDDIYVSTDGGKNWQNRTESTIYSGGSWFTTSMSESGQDIAVASFDNDIIISRDAGLTWSDVGDNLTLADGASIASIVMSDDGQTIHVTDSNSAVYVSTDSGQTWSPVALNLASVPTLSLMAVSGDGQVLAASDPDGSIYVSRDGGQTWQMTAEYSGVLWRSIVVSQDGTRIAVLNNFDEILVSEDGGLTWIDRGETLDGLRYITFSADGSRLMVIDFSGEIFISEDLGVTWTNLNEYVGILPLFEGWTDSAVNTDGETIVLAARNSDYSGIYVSNDGGQTWQYAPASDFPKSPNWSSVYVSPDGQTMVAADNGNTGGIYVSNDGGDSWNKLTYATELEDTVIFNEIIVTDDGETIFALAQDPELYVSNRIPDPEPNPNPTPNPTPNPSPTPNQDGDSTVTPGQPVANNPGSTGAQIAQRSVNTPQVTPEDGQIEEFVALDPSDTPDLPVSTTGQSGPDDQDADREGESDQQRFLPYIIGGILGLLLLIVAIIAIIRAARKSTQ